jgi:hypothetical protein
LLEYLMRFYLTYEGPVYSTQKDSIDQQRDAGAPHKHDMRRAFHSQLKQLWATNKFLRTHTMDITNANNSSTRPIADNAAYWGAEVANKLPFSEIQARRYTEHGYRFAPLVCEDFSLLCSLRILFLRRDAPGSVVSAGDIDNRLKTVIDALRRPLRPAELVGNEVPKEGEDPFYVLLEDDKQVTHLEVETDTLLDAPAPGNADRARARLVIAVEIRPYNLTYFNLSFA